MDAVNRLGNGVSDITRRPMDFINEWAVTCVAVAGGGILGAMINKHIVAKYYTGGDAATMMTLVSSVQLGTVITLAKYV
jgi:hypothetical protein